MIVSIRASNFISRLGEGETGCVIGISGDGVMWSWLSCWDVIWVNFFQLALSSMNLGWKLCKFVGGLRLTVVSEAKCGVVVQSNKISQSEMTEISGLVIDRDRVVLFSVVGIRGVFIRIAFRSVWRRVCSFNPRLGLDGGLFVSGSQSGWRALKSPTVTHIDFGRFSFRVSGLELWWTYTLLTVSQPSCVLTRTDRVSTPGPMSRLFCFGRASARMSELTAVIRPLC